MGTARTYCHLRETNMDAFALLKVNFFMNLLAIVWMVVSVVLILIILVQKGRGGGLGGAFGGGMAGGLLGSKTGDFLTWVTIVMVTLFLTLAVVLVKYYRPTPTEYGQESTPPAGQMQTVEQPEDTAAGLKEAAEDINTPTQ